MKNLILVAALIAVSGYAQAGHEVGNGGGVIYCKDQTVSMPPQPIKETAELLDLYEARVLRNLKLSLGDPNEDYSLKIARVLQKMARIAPLRAKKYTELYENFFNETVIIPDADLVFIPDADNLVLPKGCQLKQVTIQKVPDFPGDNRYFISKEYWDKMDNNSKAALVLHEILYNEAIYLGHTDSRAVRYLNSYLTSDRFDTLTQNQFTYMLFMAKFQTADYLGTMVEIRYDDKDFNLNFRSLNYPDVDPRKQRSFFSDLKLPASIQFGPYTLGDKFEVSFSPKQIYSISGAIEINLPRLKFKGFNGALGRADFGIWFVNGAIAFVNFSKEGAVGKETFVAQYDDSTIELEPVSLPGYSSAFAQLSFENDQSMQLNGYTGKIRIKNETTGYQSPKLISEGKGRIAGGILRSGILSENGVFQTAQGNLSFITWSYSSDPKQDSGSIYSEFDENSLLTTGVLAAGQKVRTNSGDVTTERDMKVRFIENGSAVLEELPSATAPNP